MRKKRRKLLSSALACIALCACNKVPSEVIQPDEMALLMADVHTGEAVVELNWDQFRSDSAKQVLKESVYAAHGVTAEQVDSSLAWYGRNITYYMDVYDNTISILEKRLIERGNKVAAAAAMSVAGDSVDVWTGPRFMRIYDRLPSKNVLFGYERDRNWERGDIYTWRAKFFNNSDGTIWQIVAEYSDGTIEFIENEVRGEGWKEIELISDSTADLTRVYGFLEPNNTPGTTMALDSMEIVRKRTNKDNYSRRYMLKRLRGVLPEVKIDTAVTASETVGDTLSVK